MVRDSLRDRVFLSGLVPFAELHEWTSSAYHGVILEYPAARIPRILEDDDERQRRGANGRRRVEERYNWELEAKHLVAQLDGLMVEETGATR